VAKAARRLLAVCRQLRLWGISDGLERYGTRPGNQGNPDFSQEAGVLIARRPRASRVIFVFTGNARMIWVSLHVLHQLMPKDDCHIVYLRDIRGLGYLDGIPELGAGYERTLDGFRGLVTSLGDPKVYCVGSSAGGYASLRYGLDLRARAILAFSPLTDGWQLQAASGGRIAADAIVDLRTLYAAASAAPAVTLVFGEKNEEDAAASRRLAGLPTVTLQPVPHYDRHDVIAQTIATGEFLPFINRLLSVP
jgi:pimeloyl-ACP methyl ester carboxylesterase